MHEHDAVVPTQTVGAARSAQRLSALLRRVWRYRLAFLFVLPAVVLVLIFIGYPVVDSVIVSLTRWDGIGKASFVGLDNYRKLLADAPSLLNTLWITIKFTVVATGGSAILGFFLAVAIAERVKGWQFFRIAFFIPILLPLTVVGILWGLLLDPTNGVVNMAIHTLGLPAPLWLASTSLALWTIVGVSIWQYTGFPMIVFLAAIESIPPELYEAARIDGAGGWQRLWAITWPLVRPVALVLLMLQIIFGLRTFDIAWAMTEGGPGTATTLLAVKLYQTAFLYSNFGYASTIAVFMIVFIGSIAYLYLTLGRPAMQEL